MPELMLTRFNDITWNENCRWRDKNAFSGCIYNSPVHIKEDIPLMITIYVIEMNNDQNKIMGIGKIINKVCTDQNYRIYEERNYNRYTYRGKSRIDRKEIESNNLLKLKLEKLEKRLFKGKSHLKRGQGINRVPPDVYKYCKGFPLTNPSKGKDGVTNPSKGKPLTNPKL
jgi:hypothetical protein